MNLSHSENLFPIKLTSSQSGDVSKLVSPRRMDIGRLFGLTQCAAVKKIIITNYLIITFILDSTC